MSSTLHCYVIKGPIEVDATIAKLTKDILKMVKYPKPLVGDEMSS